jgi:hypothetical protein
MDCIHHCEGCTEKREECYEPMTGVEFLAFVLLTVVFLVVMILATLETIKETDVAPTIGAVSETGENE